MVIMKNQHHFICLPTRMLCQLVVALSVLVLNMLIRPSSGFLLRTADGWSNSMMPIKKNRLLLKACNEDFITTDDTKDDDDDDDMDCSLRRRRFFPSLAMILASPPAVMAAHASTPPPPPPVPDRSSVAAPSPAILGPLALLVGTWTGDRGLSIVAMPSRKSKPNDAGRFELQVRPYREILTFPALPGDAVRNRGGDLNQYVGALEYKQEVYAMDNDDNDELMHVENGMLFYLDNVQRYRRGEGGDGGRDEPRKPKYSIARSASVPHGNSAMLLGTVVEMNGMPTIPDISAVPKNIGLDAPPEYMNPYIKPRDVRNPNALLQQDLLETQQDRSRRIAKTVHFSFDSKNKGSAVTSIPFLVERADTTSFSSDFWLETRKGNGSPQQLQYSQSMDIAFHRPIIGGAGSSTNGKSGNDDDDNDEKIQWPHVTVNTLVRSDLS